MATHTTRVLCPSCAYQTCRLMLCASYNREGGFGTCPKCGDRLKRKTTRIDRQAEIAKGQLRTFEGHA